MLLFEMSVHTADTSSNSNVLEIDKSVESADLDGKTSFKDVFESASSDSRESKDIPETQKVKDYIDNKKDLATSKKDQNKEEPGNTKASGNSKLQINQNNKKLLSLKKTTSKDLHDKSKNTKKGTVELKNHPAPSKLGKVQEPIKQKTDGTKKSSLIDKKDSGTDNTEVQAKTTVSPLTFNTIHMPPASTGKVLQDQSKLLTPGVSEDGQKKGTLKKKSSLKKDNPNKKAKIVVHDLRSADLGKLKAKHTLSNSGIDSSKLVPDQNEQIHSDSDNSAKPIIIELTHVKDHFSGESKTISPTSGSALMKQLEESINNKIVKQTSLVLKDSGSGEIKLVLKPEQLGNVRIKLNMHDNHISGNIFVDNSVVKNVFEQNMLNLERAFRENGFDTASLNVSVGGDHKDSNDRENGRDIIKQIKMIDENIPSYYNESENLINLVV